MLDEITPEASLTRIEEEMRRFWRRHDVPGAVRTASGGGAPPYVIYPQPLPAASQSWDAQVRLLATADLVARYRAMQGDAVHCQVGWACHGLPVEVGVERSLGPELAHYDLARFNAACREASLEGIRQGQGLAERLGVWLDLVNGYETMSPQAIGAVWWALRRLWEDGRLKRERRVAAVCPRCATPLSSSQAARKAAETESSAVWLCLPWDGEPDAYFLVWTPVPWMLPGMVALAVCPESSYVLVEPAGRQDRPGMRLVLSEAALERSIEGDYRLVRRLAGRSLRGAGYAPPFTFLPAGEAANCVILSEAVSPDRGTGMLPVTPASDAWSLALAGLHNLSIPRLLDDWGNLDDRVVPWRGLSPLDAEPLIVENLETRGLLYRQEPVVRPRALCPYCDTALVPSARTVWLVDTAGGPWILGRDRAWGAPLPVWTCQTCGAVECVAGLDDLAHRLDMDADQIDPHRPDIDRLALSCESCGGVMRRTAEVIDEAFEAAVLPWATARQQGPANLAIGVGDPHLDWLGDLTEVAALLRGSLAWEQAVALPESGWGPEPNRMHSWPSDAVRWGVYTGTDFDRAEKEFLRPLWRLFVATCAQEGGQGPEARPRLGVLRDGSRNAELLDRWLSARLQRGIRTVTEALDACQLRRAAEELASLVTDLVEWYAPHRPTVGKEVFQTLSCLLAPFVPHLAEAVHRELNGNKEESVHLAVWPCAEPALDDVPLLTHMAVLRRLASLAQAARGGAGLDPDKTLGRAIVDMGDDPRAAGIVPLAGFLAEILRVLGVQFAPDAPAPVDWSLALHQERTVQRNVATEEIVSALAGLAADRAAEIALQLRRGLSVSLPVAGQAITLLPDEVSLSIRPRAGWAVAADGEYVVMLQ